MFPTKAGEFATAPRQESTVVPHPLIRIPLAPSAGGSSAIEKGEYDFRAWLWLRSLHRILFLKMREETLHLRSTLQRDSLDSFHIVVE